MSCTLLLYIIVVCDIKDVLIILKASEHVRTGNDFPQRSLAANLPFETSLCPSIHYQEIQLLGFSWLCEVLTAHPALPSNLD